MTTASQSLSGVSADPGVDPAARAKPAAEDPAVYVRKVGKGRTLLKSLERHEAAAAFGLLLEGGFTDAQAGAFLQALRIKELSSDELDGLLDAFLASEPGGLPSLPSPSPGGFVLNLASDTPRKGGYASLLAASLLSAEGVPVGLVRSDPVLTGNRASWEATWSLARGLAKAQPAAKALPVVVSADDLVPRLRILARLRGELGFRSCLHTAEKLLNPWKDKPVVLGISHRHYAERMSDHFARRGLQAKIVLGNHGTPDLVLHKETEVWEVLPGGGIRCVQFHPGELGLEPDASLYSLGAFAQWEAELAKPGHGALGPILEYHKAFLRYVAGLIPHPRDSLKSTESLA
jgi:anthranilate phosphoribosyltransferase